MRSENVVRGANPDIGLALPSMTLSSILEPSSLAPLLHRSSIIDRRPQTSHNDVIDAVISNV
jgi:hypothetical protein